MRIRTLLTSLVGILALTFFASFLVWPKSSPVSLSEGGANSLLAPQKAYACIGRPTFTRTPTRTRTRTPTFTRTPTPTATYAECCCPSCTGCLDVDVGLSSWVDYGSWTIGYSTNGLLGIETNLMCRTPGSEYYEGLACIRMASDYADISLSGIDLDPGCTLGGDGLVPDSQIEDVTISLRSRGTKSIAGIVYDCTYWSQDMICEPETPIPPAKGWIHVYWGSVWLDPPSNLERFLGQPVYIDYCITEPDDGPSVPPPDEVYMDINDGVHSESLGPESGWCGTFAWDGVFGDPLNGVPWDGSELSIELSGNIYSLLVGAGGPTSSGGSISTPPFHESGGNGSSCSIDSAMPAMPQTLVSPNGMGPTWVLGRDSSFFPFGDENPDINHPIFRYLQTDRQGSQTAFHYIEGGEGGSWIYELSNINGVATYVDVNGDIQNATRYLDVGNDRIEWNMGGLLHVFDTPSSADFGWGKLRTITNLETSQVTSFTYTSTRLTGISDPEIGSVVITWTLYGTKYHVTKIAYSGGREERYGYDGGTNRINSFEEWASTTRIQAYSLIADQYGRITTITKKDPSTGTAVGTNTYSYLGDPNADPRNNLLDTYQEYGDTYSRDYEYGTTDRSMTVTNPDGSYTVQETTDNDEVRVITTSLYDSTTPQHRLLTRNESEENIAHSVIQASTDGEGNETRTIYGFHIESATDDEYATLLHKITYPLENYSQYIYDGAQLERISQKDKNNIEQAYTQFDYDADGRITKTYTGNYSESQQRYENDHLRRTIDGVNRSTWYKYNGDGQLIAVGDGSATTTNVYDASGRRIRTVSPRGIHTEYKYNSTTGNLLQVYNDVHSSSVYVTNYTYDISGYGDNLIQVVDAMSRKTTYEYDGYDRLIREKVWDGATLMGTIQYRYDTTMGEYLKSKVDMIGNNTNFSYYAPGFLKTKTWYEKVGGATSEWGSMQYLYNLNGAVSRITSSGGDCSCSGTKYFYYNENIQPTTKTAIQGGTIEYVYDGIDRLDRVKIPGKDGSVLNKVDYAYDVANRITNVNSDSTVNDFVYTYNKANQITDFSFSGSEVTNTYDPINGRLNQIYLLDYNNQAKSIDYGHNADGFRTTAKYDNGRTVLYAYDNLNRLVRESGHDTTISRGISLDGTGDYLDPVAGGDLAASMAAITIEAKVYMNQFPTSQGVIFRRGVSGSENYAKLSITSQGYVVFELETDSGDDSATYSEKLPTGQWMHIAATWSNGVAMKIYVNGSLRVTGSVLNGTLLGTSTNRPRIGEGINGRMDEVHVRNLAATTFYANLFTDYSVSANTLGLWHLNETSGTTAADADTGDPQNATLYGNATWSAGTGTYGIPHYARVYEYDYVGNRTKLIREWSRSSGSTAGYECWRMEYNALNQLIKRYSGGSWTGVNGDIRFEYQYDLNGNLTQLKQEQKSGGAWSQVDKWVYKWNPRDQMQRAIKYTTTANNVGSVTYEYCLTCAGVISKRFEYAGGTGEQPGALTSGKRYEYDGLNLLRMDELYDDDVPTNGLQKDSDGWRNKEVATHVPGSVGNLLGKMVYAYSSNTDAYSTATFYSYLYDAVGNLTWVQNNSGILQYTFAQDAFGNELNNGSYTGTSWATARNSYGITEHQTGKWIDPFTGLYYFSARWYDPFVGRFVGRDPGEINQTYKFVRNCPTRVVDPTGLFCCHLDGSARSMYIKLRKCGGHPELEGVYLSLGVPPANDPSKSHGQYEPRHLGWSIPTGIYNVEWDDPKEWYRIWSRKNTPPRSRFDWIIEDSLNGDWHGVSIHIHGTHSGGCWGVSGSSYEKLKTCCGGNTDDGSVNGSIKIIDRIYGPEDPFWDNWHQYGR